MAKFRKNSKTSQEIPTSALPDIIFMLLFFFMVTTVLRETEILVEQRIPKATQLRKLERKSLVSYVYVGQPKKAEFGTEPKIQVNDIFIAPKDLILFVQQEKDNLAEAEKDQLTISMKVDEEARMGIISDVQQQLREVNARKVMYSVVRRDDDI
ncbi:MAG: ExbD/TolR family protein [Cyclobacteriaceae bacterium]